MNRRGFMKGVLGLLGFGTVGGLAGWRINKLLSTKKNKIEFSNLSSVVAATPTVSVPKFHGKVIVIRNEKVWNGNKLDNNVVQEMLESAIKKLTGKNLLGAAWESFFNPEDVVGIKINAIAGRRLSSSRELVNAIILGLRMAGVKNNNIIVWDRTNRELIAAGYKLNTSEIGVKCFGTDTTTDTIEVGYDDDITIAGDVGSKVSKIVSKYCTALINVPVLKDHDVAGVTISLKNYFGAIHNPNKLHENGCNPYVADLNTMDVFRNKTRLIICDATRAQCEGGPGYKSKWAWKYSALLVGTDPVALDRVGTDIIEQRRKEVGLKSLTEEKRFPKYLASAAASSRNLGIDKLEDINTIWI